jgi:uncharacterized membrane protein (DUF373 family)
MRMFEKSALLDRIMVYVEYVVSATLVLIGAFLTFTLVIDFVAFVLSVLKAGIVEAETLDAVFGHEGVFELLNHVLVVFIVIELFKIAVAYMNHEAVIGTVLEAALIAVVRQFVIFEQGELERALALSILAVSVGIVWYLLQRSGVRGLDATYATLTKAVSVERKLIEDDARILKDERAREATAQHPEDPA